MNEEKYILAELKRWLAKKAKELMYGHEILQMLAILEADAVLGEECEPEGLPFEDEEVE